MPYPLFDRSKLLLKPLAESILTARKNDAAVMLMYGAHVIRTGCAPHMIEMMRRGQLTHLATNGA